VTTIGPIRRALFCALVATVPNLTGCGNVRITPGDPDEIVKDCRQMKEKLTDKTTTPARAAEIKSDMDKAECGRLLPGP
jgi:hypothetical protein